MKKSLLRRSIVKSKQGSLHTDLAAKLQNRASSNSIMIGDNIKNILDLPDEFIGIKTYQKDYLEKKDTHILYKPEKKYRMWVFKHDNYLKYFPQLQNENFKMVCKAGGDIYYPNISALPKYKSLTFEVRHPLSIPPRGINNIRYVWSKTNRGVEAKENNQDGKLSASITRNNEADESTAYKGHHIMECNIKQNDRINGNVKFGIFIK